MDNLEIDKYLESKLDEMKHKTKTGKFVISTNEEMRKRKFSFIKKTNRVKFSDWGETMKLTEHVFEKYPFMKTWDTTELMSYVYGCKHAFKKMCIIYEKNFFLEFDTKNQKGSLYEQAVESTRGKEETSQYLLITAKKGKLFVEFYYFNRDIQLTEGIVLLYDHEENFSFRIINENLYRKGKQCVANADNLIKGMLLQYFYIMNELEEKEIIKRKAKPRVSTGEVKVKNESGTSDNKVQKTITLDKLKQSTIYYDKADISNRTYVKRERHMDCWGVRGHWRYYKNTGKKVWVTPYTKGEGEVIGKEIKL